MALLTGAVAAVAGLLAGAVAEGAGDGAAGGIRTGNGTITGRRGASAWREMASHGRAVTQVFKGGILATFARVGKDKTVAVVNA